MPLNLKIGEDDVFGGVEIPSIAGVFLIMPDVLSSLHLEGNNGAGEQIVAAPGTAKFFAPGCAVTGANVELIELWIIGDRVPHRAAAAKLPPLATPGLTAFARIGFSDGFEGSPGTV